MDSEENSKSISKDLVGSSIPHQAPSQPQRFAFTNPIQSFKPPSSPAFNMFKKNPGASNNLLIPSLQTPSKPDALQNPFTKITPPSLNKDVYFKPQQTGHGPKWPYSSPSFNSESDSKQFQVASPSPSPVLRSETQAVTSESHLSTRPNGTVLFKVPDLPQSRRFMPTNPEGTTEKPDRMDRNEPRSVTSPQEPPDVTETGHMGDDNDSFHASYQIKPTETFSENEYRFQNQRPSMQSIIGDFIHRFQEMETCYQDLKREQDTELGILSHKNKDLTDSKEGLENDLKKERLAFQEQSRQVTQLQLEGHHLIEKLESLQSKLAGKVKLVEKLESEREQGLKRIASLEAEVEAEKGKGSGEYLDQIKQAFRDELKSLVENLTHVKESNAGQETLIKSFQETFASTIADVSDDIASVRQFFETHFQRQQSRLDEQITQLQDEKIHLQEEVQEWKLKFEELQLQSLAEASKLSDEVNRLKVAYEEALTEVVQLKEVVDSNETELNNLKTSSSVLSCQLENERSQWDSKVDAMQKTQELFAEQIKDLKNHIEELSQEKRAYAMLAEQQIELLKKEIVDYCKEIDVLKAKVDEYKDKFQKALHTYKDFETEKQRELEELSGKLHKQLQSIDEYESKVAESQKKIHELEDIIVQYEQDRHQIGETNQQKIRDLTDRIKNVEDEKDRLSKEVNEGRKQKPTPCNTCSETEALKAKVQVLRKELQDYSEREAESVKKLKAQISDLQTELSDKENKYQKELEEKQSNWKRISDARENEARNNLLQKDNRIKKLEAQLKHHNQLPKSPLTRQSLTQIARTGSDSSQIREKGLKRAKESVNLDEMFDMDVLASLELPESQKPTSVVANKTLSRDAHLRKPTVTYESKKRKEYHEHQSEDVGDANEREPSSANGKRNTSRKSAPKSNKLRRVSRQSKSNTNDDIFDCID